MVNAGMRLFDGRAGDDSALVWLEPDGRGAVLRSESLGPGVERAFGSDALETALHIGATELEVLAAALVADHPELDSTAPAIEVLAVAYRGDSATTKHVRHRLDALGLTATFTMR